MKKIISILVVMLAAPLAFACPDLTGSYTCQDGSETYPLTIKTYMENGVTVYEADGDKIYADGVTRPIQEEDMNGQYSTTCAGNTVDMIMDGDLLENGQAVGKFSMTTKLTQNAVGYEQVSEGQATYKGQQFPINQMATCRKN